MKSKVLFITDSLSLPRLKPEVVLYEDTYVSRCKAEFPEIEFISLQLGAADIRTLYNQLFYYKAVKPDLIIVQSGIVDCAPRAFSPVELALLNSSPLFNTISKKLLKPLLPYLRKHRKKTSTDSVTYRQFVAKFIDEFQDTPLFWNSIMPGTDGYEKQIPGIKKNIDTYNSILKDELKDSYIDNSEFKENSLMSDHHHLNELGHTMMFEKLKGIIYKFREGKL